MERRLAAVLVADVVGYSRLMAVDEIATLERLKALETGVILPIVEDQGGRLAKLMGDGYLCEFPSAAGAVAAATRILQENHKRERAMPQDARIALRSGITQGDVIISGTDIFGNGVNIAARLESMAQPDTLCISHAAYDSLPAKRDYDFDDLGEHRLKNIPDPVRVYRYALPSETVTAAGQSATTSERGSLAVLPFRNLSGDADQDHFCDGVTEDIIIDLSKVASLSVASRNATYAYKGKAVPLETLARDLDVNFVVEGSIRRAGDRIRVTAEISDAVSGRHIWGDRYDRDLTDVFAVQDDITRNIVDAMRLVMSPVEQAAIARRPTADPAAYEKYLQGRQFLHAMTMANLERARRCFSDATKVDPGYARAWAGIADCDALMYNYYTADKAHIDRAIDIGRKALELDPHGAEVHASYGLALSLAGNAEAVGELELAIELDPTLYEPYWYYGLILVKAGALERGLDMFRRASETRTDDLQSVMMQIGLLGAFGQGAELRNTAQRALDMVTRRLQLNPEDARSAQIGAQALHHLGQDEKALEWLDLAAELDSSDSRTNYNIACVYSMLGRNDQSLHHLALAINAGRPGGMKDWALTDPELDLLRKDQRFWSLMENWK